MWRALGIFLIFFPFIPLEPFFGMFRDDIGNFTPLHWGLGVGIVVLLSLAVTVLSSRADVPQPLSVALPAPVHTWQRFGFVLLSILLVGLMYWISAQVFQHRPLLVDTVVQLFQAKIFAAGSVTASTPPFPEFFITQHMVIDGGHWYSQYPPGHSLILAAGVMSGWPWAPSLVLSAFTIAFLVMFTREVFDKRTALITLCLVPFCGFFLFMSVSYMNHVSTLFFLAIALYGYARWENRRQLMWIFVSGLAVGGAFSIRPLCAIAAGGTIALWGSRKILAERRWKDALCGIAGFVPLGALYFWYNYATTGDPFLPGYLKLWGQEHNIGFHISPWGEDHTPWSGLGKQLRNFAVMNEFLFESIVPGLWPLALLLIFGKPNRWERRLVWLFLAYPALYFFYWHRDSFLGPRFLHASLLALLPLTARFLLFVEDSTARPSAVTKFRGRVFQLRTFAYSALFFVAAYVALLGIPQRFAIYASSLSSMKFDLAGFAEAQGIQRGIIFVPVSWGTRILNELRAAGLGASESEQFYRKTDHCLLQQLVDEADQTGLKPEEVRKRAEEFSLSPVVRVRANNDPTLRLRPAVPLSARCRDEILYDKKGYTLYMPYLAANAPVLQGGLIFATDLRDRNHRLVQALGDLPAYRFRNFAFEPLSFSERE